MSARVVLATAARILRQLRRDPRTLALILVVPVVLVTLVSWVLDGRPGAFDRVGVPLLGILPLISMFLVTSITMLRERTGGTLERLMTLPLSRLDLLAGYALAFGAVAAVQGAAVTAVAIGALGLDLAGPVSLAIALAVANALLGMALGLLVSAFAATEFQAVQFMPGLILPQVLVCGLFIPRAEMARPVELFSDLMPLSYAYSVLEHVARSDALTATLARDAGIVVGTTLLALALGAATLRRRTA